MYIECIHYETIDAYYAEMALNSTRHHLRQHFKVHEIVFILELGAPVCLLHVEEFLLQQFRNTSNE